MKLASLTRLPGVDNPAMRGTAAQDQTIDPAVAQTKRRRMIVIGASAGLIVLLLTAWLVYRWMDSATIVPRARVRIAEVTVGRFVRDVSAQGAIVAAVSPTLYAPSAGTVTLIAKPGAKVAKGELLATIESPELRNEYQRERATLDSLNTDLERQRIEVRRKVLANQLLDLRIQRFKDFRGHAPQVARGDRGLNPTPERLRIGKPATSAEVSKTATRP